MLQRTLSTRTCGRISFENEVLRSKHRQNCENGPSQVQKQKSPQVKKVMKTNPQ